jgi:hypothetical protein
VSRLLLSVQGRRSDVVRSRCVACRSARPVSVLSPSIAAYIPFAFECRAGDVYVRLDDPLFLVAPRADAQNHDDGPAKTNGKPGLR